MKSVDLLVVGAGIAGLSVAVEAQARGKTVAIVEISPSVGGLCGSFEAEGCFLDYGVHLLHARDSRVMDFVEKVVPRELIVPIKRSGRLYLRGRYLDWPLSWRSPFQLEPTRLIKMVYEQLSLLHRKVQISSSDSYADAARSLFGPELYKSFFEPLTQKFFKLDANQVHSDWATSSMRSATKVEDKAFRETGKYHQARTEEAEGISAFRTLVDSFRSRIFGEAFFYFRDGYGTLPNKLAEKFEASGGVLMTAARVNALTHNGSEIVGASIVHRDRSSPTDLTFDRLLWTGNLEAYASLVGVSPSKISRLDSVFVYLFLSVKSQSWQTCYFVGDETDFVRATFLSNHSATIIRRDDVASVVCLEYTFSQGDALIVDKAEAVRQAVAAGLIASAADVISSHTVEKSSTYPVFSLDYADELDALNERLPEFANFFSFGRQGRFSYENADILILEALSHDSIQGW